MASITPASSLRYICIVTNYLHQGGYFFIIVTVTLFSLFTENGNWGPDKQHQETSERVEDNEVPGNLRLE
jgi:predicted small integral membrane protein